ncbi:MAG TPA: EamA family transporter, partial [Bryobacteraceae bacterium]
LGSIIAFTSYLWLLHYESPTKVGTYAYVNPVVAVIIGAVLGAESIGPRTIVATALILIGVLLIASGSGKSSAPKFLRDRFSRRYNLSSI